MGDRGRSDKVGCPHVCLRDCHGSCRRSYCHCTIMLPLAPCGVWQSCHHRSERLHHLREWRSNHASAASAGRGRYCAIAAHSNLHVWEPLASLSIGCARTAVRAGALAGWARLGRGGQDARPHNPHARPQPPQPRQQLSSQPTSADCRLNVEVLRCGCVRGSVGEVWLCLVTLLYRGGALRHLCVVGGRAALVCTV